MTLPLSPVEPLTPRHDYLLSTTITSTPSPWHIRSKNTHRSSFNSDAISLTESIASIKYEPDPDSDAPMLPFTHQHKGKQHPKPMKPELPESPGVSELISLDSASISSESEQSQSVNMPAKCRRHQPLIKMESSRSLLSHGNLKDKPIEVEMVLTWPVNFYVCDIAEGSKVCHTAANTHVLEMCILRIYCKTYGQAFPWRCTSIVLD
jgi:hypothetical protein